MVLTKKVERTKRTSNANGAWIITEKFKNNSLDVVRKIIKAQAIWSIVARDNAFNQ